MSTLFMRHHDVRHAHLAGQQNVLARLRHGAVGRRHHQDRAVHLRRAGDHVLDVVGVARAIHVRVVPLGGLVLHVRHRDRDSAGLFFRRVVDRIEAPELVLRIVLGQRLGDGRRQRGLAVIDVPDRPDVDVRLAAIKFSFAMCASVSCGIFVTLALHLADDLFRDALRNFFVLAEVHRESCRGPACANGARSRSRTSPTAAPST